MDAKEMRYAPYREQDYEAVSDLLRLDALAGENIFRALAKAPELFVTAWMGDALVGLAQVNEPVPTSYLTVYVAPRFRRQGIGSALLEQAETKLRSGETVQIRSSYRAGHPSTSTPALAFAGRHGYAPYFSSAFMRRFGEPFPLEELPVGMYRDEDYPAAQSLYAAVFHEMRVRVGHFPDSVVAQPSDAERSEWKADAATRYIYEWDGDIAAYSHVSGNEIGSVAVRTDLQGRGIGRKLVMYVCNEIYRRGSADVRLGCVVGNDARELYESLGFQEKYTMAFVRKML